jgi:DNA transposition AAA+ family ATPase
MSDSSVSATSNPHFLKLEGAAAMNTVSFAATRDAFADAAEAEAIALIHGDAGLGKSFAMQHAIATAGLPVAALAFHTHMTLKRLLQELLFTVTGVPHPGTRYALFDSLRETLADEPRLIVLDEAQLLNHESVETLRSLWDDSQTRFALVLVGGNGCWDLINSYPMLSSRIYTRVAFQPLNQDDVLELIPLYHPIYRDASARTIERIDKRFARGNFREWAAFTHMAKRICERDNTATVTNRVATEALDRIGRVIRAA